MASLYANVCRKLLLPAGDLLMNQRVMHHLSLYESSQYWPASRLRAECDRRLRDTIATAYAEVPFYRDLYQRCGVTPGDVRSIEDLHLLPIVNKSMLREAFPTGCTRPTKYRWHDYSTSGSTGNPFTVRVDDDTMSRARALMILRTMYAGWSPGDPTLQTGMAVARGSTKMLKDRFMRIHYVSAFDLSDAVLDDYLTLIERHRIRYLTGYAQSLFLLAKRARYVGFNRNLDGAVSWGSNMLQQYRDEIRAAFRCETYDSYGVGEGMQIGAQCGRVDGAYHQFSLHVVCETVTDGKPVPAGELGEIVLTRLDAGAMPLIRYAVGDMGRQATAAGCACGRNLPLLQAIDGRTSDIVRTPSGNRLIVEFFNGIFQYAPTIEHFQILQTELDSIHVRIVPGADFQTGDWDAVQARILEKGDPDLRITVEQVPEIPLEPSHKRRYIKSSLGA